MDAVRLQTHIRLCKKNLRSKRVKCCALCPFEEEIVEAYPDLKALFDEKRSRLRPCGLLADRTRKPIKEAGSQCQRPSGSS